MFKLAPAEYLIVPSSFKPDETASFILRILSKSETHAQYAQTLHRQFFIIMLKMHTQFSLRLPFFPVTILGKATVQLKRYAG